MSVATRPTSVPSVLFRAARCGPGEPEEGLVYSSWQESYRSSWRAGGGPCPHCKEPIVKRVPDSIYYRFHADLIRRTLERPEVEVICAHASGEERHVYGWICWEPAGSLAVIHYIYVKRHYRRMGLARLLAAHVGIGPDSRVVYTWEPKAAPHVAKKVLWAEYVEHADFLALGPGPQIVAGRQAEVTA